MRMIWTLVLVLVACESDDTPARTCDAPDGPAACLCSADPPTAEPIMPVDTCNADAVVSGDTVGLCCESGDKRSCGCAAIGCFTNEVGICTCGTAVEFAGLGTTEVASCAADAATQRCCLSAVDGYCRCSSLTCAADATQVDSCSKDDVAVCPEGDHDVGSCAG